MSNTHSVQPKIVSRAEWLVARKKLMAEEKELTRQQDAVSARRRELPWVKVDQEYVFDSPGGKKTLAQLFDGRSQLAVYHFMFGPDWKEGCPSCSMAADHFNGSFLHLAQRDVTLLAVSRASVAQIEAFKKRMGWNFEWVSSQGNAFNRDYHVSFTKDELTRPDIYNFETSGFPSDEAPGLSVFYKDEKGAIFHTYSCYARGLDPLLTVYTFLDRVPKGRDEGGLPHGMAWVRHHDRYSQSYFAEAMGAHAASKDSGSSCH